MAETLVEVTRGPHVESTHTGIVAVCDDTGRLVFGLGDTGRPVYPRSAVKVIQALPLVESGAADRFGFGDAELALACASHSGEPDHVATARRMLAASGCGEHTLECGAHWSSRQDALISQARSIDAPTAAYNNCSGKHSGFIALAMQRRVDPAGYVGADHPVQVEIRAALEDVVGTGLDPDTCGTDGCSIPTYAIPLDRMATGFAKLGTGRGLAPSRAAAARRLFEAVAASPWHVAGTGRFCTDIMRLLGKRVFVKTGAEGVFCASFPGQGLGVALKVDDGGTRASEVMMAALIERFVPLDAQERAALQHWVRPQVKNWRGVLTGEVRPSEVFSKALAAA